MFATSSRIPAVIGDFRIDCMMRYSLFVPRLYNLCKSLGFDAGHIMPSRAFCSDENQGYPIILIAKHFGTFPFNHGMVGGIVASDRHGAHADHGQDLVIIQASHVGYDPDRKTFGTYRRINTPNDDDSVTCGKVGSVIEWYQEEYRFAQNNIYLGREGDSYLITIDNQLLHEEREQGLFLHLDRLVGHDADTPQLVRIQSTAHVFQASPDFVASLPGDAWPATGERRRIGDFLAPELFRFRRPIAGDIEGRGHLEQNLINPMPWIVTSSEPLLVAAQVNTQAEFDRAFRTIVRARAYRGRKILFIACLNIDISPREGQLFPLTKCVPWAAYIQDDNGSRTLEQHEIVDLLVQQSTENPDQIDLEQAIRQMEKVKEIRIEI